ncbi:MAG: GIY-YIG nuclease family protein [Nanoarchaeota archaeon]|nr:GIY-YIG nuclease family protein [Nanoarchaeota archaeon]
MKKEWYVYILECKDATFYTGVTNDLDKRMDIHAKGKGSKYVMKSGFKKLLRCAPCKNRSDACKAECQIKNLPRNEKLNWFDEN